MRFLHLVMIATLLHSAIIAEASPTGRSQWVWSDAVPMATDPVRRDQVLDLWESQGIDTGYFWVDQFTLQNNPQAYRSLIADVHARGMKAISLDGDPSFVVPGPSHDQAIARFQSVLDFNAAGSPNEQFDGAHFDNEPWALPQWNTDMPNVIQQYLTLSSEYVQMRDAAGSSMTVGADTAFILAATQFTPINSAPWNSVTKPLYQHVQDIYDTVTLLDYRDFALSMDSIDFHAQPWLDYGDAVGKLVEIGVETQGGLSPEKVTFFEEGIAGMEAELDLAAAQFLPRSSFDGFAIHYLGSYESLLLAGAQQGDFNGDGTVDAADFTVWRDNLGGDESTINGAGNGTGGVDQGDFDAWRINFGNSSALSTAQSTSPTLEPTSALLILLGILGVLVRRPQVIPVNDPS